MPALSPDHRDGSPLAAHLRTLGALLCTVAASSFSLAAAQTATGSFAVTATVQNSCTITTSDLAFGVYSTISGGSLDGSSTIQIRCTLNAAYSVSLNAGTTSGGSIASRLMANGGSTLGYNLYTSNARTTVWGDGTSGSSTVAGTGTGLSANLTVYGRINGAQNVAAGNFTDTVIATISF
jgi:spore coat protein U-like protein